MTFLYEELSLRPLLYMKIYHSWKACHFSCSRYHALAHKKPKNKTKQKMVGLKCRFNYSFQPIKITTLSMIFSVINIIVLAILFVNHNIVLPTLNVSPTLFIILCKILVLQILSLTKYAFHPNSNRPMTIFLLELNRTKDEIAQARTHTQRHMNNAWSEMASYTPCLALYCSFSSWLI